MEKKSELILQIKSLWEERINLMRLRKEAQTVLSSLATISVSADKINIIETTSSFKSELLSQIKKARHRIYITALYLQDDASGQEILTAIYQAKQKNPDLDVKIFVDFLRAQRGLMGHPESIGNVRLYREYQEKYEHPVDILGVPVKTREVLGVLHLKGFIFDDILLYSGASINDIYLQQNSRYRYDRYHVIEDSRLTDCMVSYLKNYLLTSSAVKNLTAKTVPGKKQIKPAIKQFKKKLRFGEYYFKGDSGESNPGNVSVTPLLGFGVRNNLLNETIYQLVKDTQKSIRIFTPYFNLPAKINKAVRRILKKGKQVEIVIGDKVANDFYIADQKNFSKIGIVPYVYEANLRKFVKRNQKFIASGLLKVYLWTHENNSYHLKGISCDNETHLLTGHNINPRAWRLDLENGILIQDPERLLQGKFDSEYKKILTHAKEVKHFSEIETIKDYPEGPAKLMKTVNRAKLHSILNRLL